MEIISQIEACVSYEETLEEMMLTVGTLGVQWFGFI
jgi:hypothetical protein